jgi:DNA-binding IclR family transcriptional regulator
MAGNSKEAGRSVASKISLILRTLTEGGEHSLTEIAGLAGLPISTAHRLVHEMTSWNLLERTDSGLYRAGLPVRIVGAKAVSAPSIPHCGPYILEDLAAATQHRARLGVLDGLEVAYIEKQPEPGR